MCTFVCVYIIAFARVQLRVLCLHYDAGLCVRSPVPTIYGITCKHNMLLPHACTHAQSTHTYNTHTHTLTHTYNTHTHHSTTFTVKKEGFGGGGSRVLQFQQGHGDTTLMKPSGRSLNVTVGPATLVSFLDLVGIVN